MHRVERPRERLASRGPRALAEEELLSMVLRTGYAGRSALEVARDLLAGHPEGGLGRLGLRDLRRLKGMGTSRACALCAALELARRWSGGDDAAGIAVDGAERVWALLQDLPAKRQEHFVALYLDARNRLIHRETVSIGTLTASLVHPREVFAPAVERRAASVVVAHNHPSGDPAPSPDDRKATNRLAKAGRILGIPLADHVLLSQAGYFSFREQGLL
ncbi:MAG: DNA repair protein RadC [Elusimicrobia bacterium]|nr:DNA repair protein RadC [Elusimicrobiota bacterium]